MYKKVIIQSIGISSIFFYAVCWFVDQPTHTIWYIGIGLPWLSLLISILLSFAMNKDLSWAYCYFVSTLFFVCFASIIKSELLSQIPYLAACVCVIAYVFISNIVEKYRINKDKLDKLHEQNEIQKYHVLSLKSELADIKNNITELLIDQAKYQDSTDEATLLCHNSVLYKFCKELKDQLHKYEKMDNDLY